MRTLAVLGATGSIGRQALDLISRHPDSFKAEVLTANQNHEALFDLVRAFRPAAAGLVVEPKEIPEDVRFCDWYFGPDASERALRDHRTDDCLAAVVGIAGLGAVMTALETCRRVLLANKEALVTAGDLVMSRSREMNKPILPVDSEHSAIFQCLAGQKPKNVKRIILTASGGPFYSFSRADLKKVTPAQALRHPRWKMGAKITVDSASLMNKGLEVIEAKWLFGVDISRIDVLVHPQSVVHSAIELIDGTVLAQLGIADMRIPIAYALSYPDRLTNPLPALDLAKTGNVTFCLPDTKKFPCLRLAYEAARAGGTAPVVLNAANEAAVAAFLENKICFNDLPKVIEKILDRHSVKQNPSLEEILHADGEARWEAAGILKKLRRG